MKYESFVFDLYGTLVDIRTDEGKEEVWEKLALFYGYYDAHYTPQELKIRYEVLVSGKEEVQRGLLNTKNLGKKDDMHESHPEIKIEEVFRSLFLEKGVEADEILAIHAGQFFRVLSTEYVRLYEGTEEMLQALKETGKKIYLLSNAQRIFTEYEMHTLGIAKYFDDIFISSECGVKKPDSRFFEMLLQKHGIDTNKSIMVGNDGKSDIGGAKSVGMDTLYVHSNISPKLEIKISPEDGKTEVEVYPEADYVLKEMDMEKIAEVLLQK